MMILPHRTTLYLAFPSVLLVLTACAGSAPPRSKPQYSVLYERFTAPIGEELTVSVGNHIFVEGAYAEAPILEMSNNIESTMPGSMGIPFSFSIGKTVLQLAYERGSYEFFCAPTEYRAASFPGLGSVVAENDCVGVKRHKQSGEMEWTVDNSIHNNTTTVWSRSIRDSDNVKFDVRRVAVEIQNPDFEAIYFNGYYSDLLHFTYREYQNGNAQEQTFNFDYPPKEGQSIYGVRGKVFEVVRVGNTELVYRWLSIPKG